MATFCSYYQRNPEEYPYAKLTAVVDSKLARQEQAAKTMSKMRSWAEAELRARAPTPAYQEKMSLIYEEEVTAIHEIFVKLLNENGFFE